jgi:hypothetical protein
VTKTVKKKILRWFGHLEMMDGRKLTKEIYKCFGTTILLYSIRLTTCFSNKNFAFGIYGLDLDGNTERGKPRQKYLNLIKHLKKVPVKSTRNRRAC